MSKLLVGMMTALLLAAGVVVTAQEDITFVPLEDGMNEIQSIVPEGWTLVGQGVYVRQSSDTDVTLVAQQAAALHADALLDALLPQFGLDEAPEPVGSQETGFFDWTLYSFTNTVQGVDFAFDLALAEGNGKTYLILLQTTADEYDALHESVFLPIVDAFQTLGPTEPAEPVPYNEEEVTFTNGDVTLAGTLTLPDGDAPFPVVVLVSGSGAQDRDESLAPLTALKPFRLIADDLTRNGVAVLRYDDRGVGGSGGSWADSTIQDFAMDTAAAIDYLETRDDIDPEQIGVLGHSEGGFIAAMLGASRDDIAFIVTLAGPAVSSRDLLRTQNIDLMQAEGAAQEAIDAQVDMLPRLYDAIAADDLDAFDAIVREQVQTQLALLPEGQRTAVTDPDAYADQMVSQSENTYLSNWFKSLLDYDVSEDWVNVTTPVLAIFGGKDKQVNPVDNAAALETLLDEAGNEDYEIVTLPDANHLFMAADTGAMSEYGTLPPEFTPELLPTIREWILEHVETA
jgi:pimeloyl-ACP methyl ester carboxylesterase